MVQSPPLTNPFPGLRPFELDEEHLFFGREGQSDELLTRLHRTRFLAVVGTSGSGKSSLVRAGLLPSLYSGLMQNASSSWKVAVLRPGSAPMANLAAALNDPDVFGVDPASDDAVIRTALTESTLRRGALGLVEVTQQARMEPHENLLVVVDQFEELFRFKTQAQTTDRRLEVEDEAAAFVKLLLGAVGQREMPVFVVLTMRSDFLGDCAQFRDLPETLNDSQYLIPRLTWEQMRSAIAGPVAVGGATITPRLVNCLLNDTGDNPDQLPILQHALMRTWDHWEDQGQPERAIDTEDYEAIGSMAEALSRHADQIYAGLPDGKSRRIAETLFRRLTDRGPDNRDIRRPTTLEEICAVANASEAEVVAVVNEFRGARRSFLMPPLGEPLHGATVLDISHESLMRNWKGLRDWVDNEAQAATLYKRLAETAELHAQRKAEYWRGAELANGLAWLEKQQPTKAWAERYAPNFDEAVGFLAASAKARDTEAAEKEKSRRREVNRLRTFLALLGGLSLLTGGAAVYAFTQQQQAKEQTQIALDKEQEAKEQRDIAEQERQSALNAKNEAVILAQEANEAKNKAQEQQERAEAAQHAEAQQRLQTESARLRAEEGEAEATRQTGIAKEQTTIAEGKAEEARKATNRAEVAAQEAKIERLNAQIQAEALITENLMANRLYVKSLLRGIEVGQKIQYEEAQGMTREVAAVKQVTEPTQSRSQSPIFPGTRLQVVSALRKIYHHESLERNILKGHSGGVRSVSFSPNGQTVASASADNTVKLWDLSGQELQTLTGHSGEVRSVSFSPDGQIVASASADGTVILWDLGGREPQTLTGHSDGVNSVSFSPDGQIVASGSADGTVKLWDLSGRELQTLTGHSDWVWSVSFSPDGQTVASASADGTVKLWDLSGRELQTLMGHSDWVRSVSFSPNGQTVASGSADGTVKLRNLSGRELQTLTSPLGGVNSVSFSPNGQMVASASYDGTVNLWDRSGQELETLTGHSSIVNSVSFSPNGQTVASASADGTVKLWNLSGRELQTLTGHFGGVLSVSFLPDGQTVASASADGTVKLWNLSGRELQTLTSPLSGVNSVSFSPNGQTVASVRYDGTVNLWNRSGQELETLTGHSGKVRSVSFSPDGQTVASASDDGTVKLWDLSGRELQTLTGHPIGVRSVSFSPDGQTVASASDDGTVKLWDLSGRELQTLTGHLNGVRSVSFSPDGQAVASASDDGTIILWNLDLDDLMAKSCDWLRDYMANPTTPPEEKAFCEGYLPPALPQSAALGPLNWVANVRAFLSSAIARP